MRHHLSVIALLAISASAFAESPVTNYIGKGNWAEAGLNYKSTDGCVSAVAYLFVSELLLKSRNDTLNDKQAFFAISIADTCAQKSAFGNGDIEVSSFDFRKPVAAAHLSGKIPLYVPSGEPPVLRNGRS